MKRKIYFGVILFIIFLIGCANQKIEQGNETAISQKLEESFPDDEYLSQILSEEEKILKQEADNGVDIEQWNPYFFSMGNNSETIQVFCELNNFAGEGRFLGTASLQINKISGTTHYYELILTDLTGECDLHTHSENADVEEACVYMSDFPIGYFYADKENIYQMPYNKEYLELFKESEGFLPSEVAINEYNNALKEAGKQHRGFFGYELVCFPQGVKDTFDMSQEEMESLPNGVRNPNNGNKQYHNYIEVDGEEIKYNLYPDEMVGTDEYCYIGWQENKGMISYASWTGNFKSYISFYVDRGAESPLAVYAGEQLGREIEGCHEADYDQDGENEVIFSVEIERRDEKELDKLEIYFVDDDYEMTLIDTQEVGLPEDQQDRDEDVWYPEGTDLGKYNARPVFQQGYVVAGTNGYVKFTLYGCSEEDPIKLKESEGTCTVNHGIYLMTTYLYDGSINDVTDKEFLKICAGDFSGVVGDTENLIENLEEWYTDKIFPRRFQQYECDMDHDGINELYISVDEYSAAVFHKGKEGIECWVYDSALALLDNGNLLHKEFYSKQTTYCETSAVICFDSDGNQKIIDEYVSVFANGKATDEEDLAVLKKFLIEKDANGYFYFQNGNPITEQEYFEKLENWCIW